MSVTGASPSSDRASTFSHNGHTARLQRIGGQRRDVPTFAQLNSLAYVEQAGICFSNDLEPFHVIFRATVTTLFTAEHIQKRIVEMAGQMNADYPNGEPLHFVAVLKGAFVFLSDLARAMSPRPVTLDFIAVSSYGAATKSSGEVRLLKDLDTPLQGRDVIIVEDIVDTGLTLHYLQDILRARDPKSLRTACLLSKPSRRKVDVAVEYIGFEIEDKFVVGYGLDNAGQFRHLPFIGDPGIARVPVRFTSLLPRARPGQICAPRRAQPAHRASASGGRASARGR